MTVTIQINGEDVEVKLTPEQYNKVLSEMEESMKPKKFEFKYPNKCYLLNITHVEAGGGQNLAFLVHGKYRLTEEGAELSLARNKRANRLEALAEQLGGLKEFKEFDRNWCIEYFDGEYDCAYYTTIYQLETVYMTKECATEICRMLNSGEFEL